MYLVQATGDARQYFPNCAVYVTGHLTSLRLVSDGLRVFTIKTEQRRKVCWRRGIQLGE